MSFNNRDLMLVTAGAVGATIVMYIYSYYDNVVDKKANSGKSELSEPPTTTKEIKTGKRYGTYRIRAPILRAFVAKVFVKCGCYEEDATKAAKVLILADLRGIDWVLGCHT